MKVKGKVVRQLVMELDEDEAKELLGFLRARKAFDAMSPAVRHFAEYLADVVNDWNIEDGA